MERADLALQLHAMLAPQARRNRARKKSSPKSNRRCCPSSPRWKTKASGSTPSRWRTSAKNCAPTSRGSKPPSTSTPATTFNIGSPKQLGEILFGKLALDARTRRKPRPASTPPTKQTLTALAPLHPIVARSARASRGEQAPLHLHRRAARLRSRPPTAASTPRSTSSPPRTGRLNSQDPNLQNIPIRTAQGREIRRAFVPREGDYTLLSADYSQIELRILAALTQDPGLLEAPHQRRGHPSRHRGEGLRPARSPRSPRTQRNQAKMVNYGISYGISAFGLSQRLGIPRADAKALIDGYFAQYPGIKQYMTDTVAQRPRARLRRDHHRPPPLSARPPFRQRHRARRRRAQRHQHADPGLLRRPDQDRHGANRARRPRGKLAHETAPPGPRRTRLRSLPAGKRRASSKSCRTG